MAKRTYLTQEGLSSRYMSANRSNALRYKETSPDADETWTVKKVDVGDGYVRIGDPFYLISESEGNTYVWPHGIGDYVYNTSDTFVWTAAT